MRNFNVRAKVVGPGVSVLRLRLLSDLLILDRYRECSSSTSRVRRVHECRSKASVRGSMKMKLEPKRKSRCTSTLRESVCLPYDTAADRFLRGPDEAQVARAKELAQDLLDVVRQEYEKARQGMGGMGMGGYPGYGAQSGQGYGMQQGAQAGYGGYYVCPANKSLQRSIAYQHYRLVGVCRRRCWYSCSCDWSATSAGCDS